MNESWNSIQSLQTNIFLTDKISNFNKKELKIQWRSKPRLLQLFTMIPELHVFVFSIQNVKKIHILLRKFICFFSYNYVYRQLHLKTVLCQCRIRCRKASIKLKKLVMLTDRVYLSVINIPYIFH